MELTLNERQELSNLKYIDKEIMAINEFMRLRKMDEHAIAMEFLSLSIPQVKDVIQENSLNFDNAIYSLATLFNEYKNSINKNYSTHLSSQDNDKPYEQVNHPSHYNKYDVEVVDMMEKIWGKYETAIWCKLTAFKYRMRLGEKPDNPIQQDLNKESWYLQKYNSLKKELDKNDNESK